ncbi:hypothetical protein [Bacillus suaedae]|uniref:Uncharacterized protein n=1 Tax=Halalkalibacter suaedae TaxID=2822140 RepID=A0A941AP87_9BACI|nr:hypothetical protein [Bacillus suaedae]MBP3951551.1 hypothetical protein [Bacillus suaedae]
MNFFHENEKKLVKSLIYGLIAGVYYSILYVNRTKEIINGNTHTFHEATIFEYIIEILRTSVTISITTFIIVMVYLYVQQNQRKLN